MMQNDQRSQSVPLLKDPSVRARIIAWSIAAVIFVGGAVVSAVMISNRLGAAPEAGPGDGPPPEAFASMVIPEFTLVTQDGEPVTRAMFRGKATVLAFTFTNCPAACPIMSANLIRMQNELSGSGVRIVTISVDPDNDSPAALRAYAEKRAIDTDRWTLLTGERSTMLDILASMRLGISDDPSLMVTLPDGRQMPNILHSTKFFLIGPEVTVVGLEDGTEWAGAERMARRARAADAAHRTLR